MRFEILGRQEDLEVLTHNSERKRVLEHFGNRLGRLQVLHQVKVVVFLDIGQQLGPHKTEELLRVDRPVPLGLLVGREQPHEPAHFQTHLGIWVETERKQLLKQFEAFLGCGETLLHQVINELDVL